jgi:hypothetical protein
MFMRTDEFTGRAAADGVRTPNSEVLAHFPPWTGEGEPGVWFDFLGVKTRCKYRPDAYAVLSGKVEGPPGTERAAIHETAEWSGTLRSILEARGRGSLVVVELGAGWGPWLVGAAKAAERVGIRNVHLAGVEREPRIGFTDRAQDRVEILRDAFGSRKELPCRPSAHTPRLGSNVRGSGLLPAKVGVRNGRRL